MAGASSTILMSGSLSNALTQICTPPIIQPRGVTPSRLARPGIRKAWDGRLWPEKHAASPT
eukprot:1193692-Pyramimonas_sp.AAC.1